jgi:hypothetical protein
MPPGGATGTLSLRMQTRYLIVAALVTALVILAASLVWFLRVVG